MASHYWLKLYHEILHDPKMGQLSDRLWRRCIEMFLLAGDTDNEGHLPPVNDMAWALRTNTADLAGELAELEQTGILSRDGDTWYVTKWQERQGPVSGTERTKRHREKKRSDAYYRNDSVTNRYTDVDVDVDRDVEVEVEKEKEKEQTTTDKERASARVGVDPVSRKALEAIGLQGQNLWEMLEYPRDLILGWCAYAEEAEGITNPPGFVIAKLREGEEPPEPSGDEVWYTKDEYEKHIMG